MLNLNDDNDEDRQTFSSNELEPGIESSFTISCHKANEAEDLFSSGLPA